MRNNFVVLFENYNDIEEQCDDLYSKQNLILEEKDKGVESVS